MLWCSTVLDFRWFNKHKWVPLKFDLINLNTRHITMRMKLLLALVKCSYLKPHPRRVLTNQSSRRHYSTAFLYSSHLKFVFLSLDRLFSQPKFFSYGMSKTKIIKHNLTWSRGMKISSSTCAYSPAVRVSLVVGADLEKCCTSKNVHTI